MIKLITFFALGVSILWFAVITGGVIYGATCQYNLNVNMKERSTRLTCYRGKVVALHSTFDSEGRYLSKWKVEARQLRYFNQVVYFVYSREALLNDDKADPNDVFNQISSGYKLLFYRIEQHDDEAIIFQSFPRYNILVGQIEGKLSVWD